MSQISDTQSHSLDNHTVNTVPQGVRRTVWATEFTVGRGAPSQIVKGERTEGEIRHAGWIETWKESGRFVEDIHLFVLHS